MKRTALIFGVTGQDGSYLAELLISKGYEVHGVVRRSSTFNTRRLDHLMESPQGSQQLRLHFGDVSDPVATGEIIRKLRPNEIYNLAAQSHVRVSFEIPNYTLQATGLGALNVLEAARTFSPESKIYQASSSEMFGAANPPQSEITHFYPRSPYGVAKLAAHWLCVNYREAYGLFATSGILFNHESPRRGETFVTRKITRAAARIDAGLQEKLFLGNLEAVRDWGYAPEYVVAMWRMLQVEKPSDYVVATGQQMSVREFLDASFSTLSLSWERHVEIDPKYLRPTEVDALIGDSRRAQQELRWTPTVTPTHLAEVMTLHDRASIDQHSADIPVGALWSEEFGHRL